MVRLTKIYTRTGDGGQTHLVAGAKVSKDHQRIEAYGTIDELNSQLGWALEVAKKQRLTTKLTEEEAFLAEFISWGVATHQKLFDLGAELATLPADRWEGMPLIPQSAIDALEALIDEHNQFLSPLKSFVLPSGTPLCAALHVCRTVCRRAERRIVTLMQHHDVRPESLRYINRLSDLLFVLSRRACVTAGQPEILWQT